MAFRGGRGRGRGYGRGYHRATELEFEPFPARAEHGHSPRVNKSESEHEPKKKIKELPDAGGVKEEIALFLWSHKLQRFWNSSAYYLKDGGPEADQKRKKKKDGAPEIKEDEIVELERFFDMGKKRTEQKVELADFIKSSLDYVPAELADRKPEQVRRRKVRWNQESDLQKFDIFEKQEQKSQAQDENGVKGKKEDENEEEDDERIEDEEEEISDGDYNQNIDFDDDEDDFNMDDDNDDEGTF